jgi:hypothetical protein
MFRKHAWRTQRRSFPGSAKSSAREERVRSEKIIRAHREHDEAAAI